MHMVLIFSKNLGVSYNTKVYSFPQDKNLFRLSLKYYYSFVVKNLLLLFKSIWNTIYVHETDGIFIKSVKITPWNWIKLKKFLLYLSSHKNITLRL